MDVWMYGCMDGWMDSVDVNKLVTLLDSCIKHLFCSAPFASPVLQVLCHLFHPRCPHCNQFCMGFALPHCVSQLHLSIHQRYLATWCSGPLVSCCRGIRHHTTKEGWEVNSLCSEPLINGRQCLVDQFSLSPPGRTFFERQILHMAS